MTDLPAKLKSRFTRECLAEDYARQFFDYWCAARSGQVMPPVSALDPMLLPRACLPYLSVLEVETEPLRLRARLVGTAVAEQIGMNQTGCYLDELPGAASQEERLLWCVREQRPYLAEDDITFAPNNYKRYQCLIVPFGDPTVGVERVVGVFCFPEGTTSTRSWTT